MRLKKIRSSVALRRDFEGLGSYRQVSRALDKLIQHGKLVRIGEGVYAKLIRSKITQADYLREGIIPTMRAALTRLNINWLPSNEEIDYNSGRSTQIPINPTTKVKNRFRRKLSYRNMEFKYGQNN